ncbi:MAG: toxin TcdB middle/C-terminal domain-containing protein [Bacteroidota bacterium]
MILAGNAAVSNPSEWHFEVVFDYGEYDIDPANLNPYLPKNAWALRPDPFSLYHAGFEIRTYRRCANMLLFHRFTEINTNPVLVHALRIGYENHGLTLLSQLISVQEVGYRWEQNAYTTESLPQTDFNYTAFDPAMGRFEKIKETDESFLPGLNGPEPYQLVDLFGEGIPGILFANGESVYYQSPVLKPAKNLESSPSDGIVIPPAVSSLAYQTPDVDIAFPIQRAVEGPGVQLTDVTGDGKLDLLATEGRINGFYESQERERWQGFQPFQGFPYDYHETGQSWVDITGNGLSDYVQLRDQSLRYYPSLGDRGFGPAIVQPLKNSLPVQLEKTQQNWVSFTRFAGGETPDLVQITQHQITYWPSLGYGSFGAAVPMGNCPNFGENFDSNRLFMADLDGSGTQDLIYLEAKKAILFLNQSGNTFGDPISIELPEPFDRMDLTQFADAFGSGTSSLIYSEPHEMPDPKHWVYDFCQQIKPYLLGEIHNNLGATTKIAYRSSVDYYLADKAAGLPWITPLPFPVQVVAEVTHTDAISQSTYTSQYAYHHGYYDGIEREFRGFGRVDRQDAQVLSNFDSADQQPPSLTRTWYHTGSFEYNEALMAQYQLEYWKEDSAAYQMPPTRFHFEGVPTEADRRLAYVALHGMELRHEVYGLDGTSWAETPYMVQESRIQVNELQPKRDNMYAVFLTYNLESMIYDYERNPHDPQCGHKFVLSIDAYGHILTACEVSYARRAFPDNATGLYHSVSQTSEQQAKLHMVYEQHSYLNDNEPDSYLLGLKKESKVFEITGLTPNDNGYFTWDFLTKTFQKGLPSSQERLLHESQDYYFDPNTQQELPLGKYTLQALHCRTAYVAFLSDNIPSELQAEVDSPANGYIKDKVNACYWNPGNFQGYFDDSQFYLPYYFCDAIQQNNPKIAWTYTYDTYHLMLAQMTDPLGNQESFEIDYQVLAPWQETDINGNVSEVLFDALSRVIVVTRYGQEGKSTVGFDAVSLYEPVANPSTADIVSNPSKYLQNASDFFYYDLFSWQDSQEPIYNIHLSARSFTYPRSSEFALEKVEETPAIELSLAYSDGMGREVQAKAYIDQPDTVVRYWDPSTQSVKEKTQNTAWLTTGATQYNNKGNVIQQFEPFYSNTYAFIDQQALNQVGYSSTHFYDALDREIMVLTPKQYLEKSLYGYLQAGSPIQETGYLAEELYNTLPGTYYPSSWNSLHFDVNDSIQDSPYYQAASPTEQAQLKTLPYNTPMFVYTDSLGHLIQQEQLKVSSNEQNDTYWQRDIEGNALTASDGRLFPQGLYNFETTYNLVKQPMQSTSVDAGTSWDLWNVNENEAYHKDARGYETRRLYDDLHRMIAETVENQELEPPLSFKSQYVVYGESFSSPATWNRRGIPVIHFDQSGLDIVAFQTIDGQHLSALKALCTDFKQSPDWSGINETITNELIQSIESISNPSETSEINVSMVPKLETETYTTQDNYNAVDETIEEIDPDGNVTSTAYYLNGWMKSSQIDKGPSVDAITYNARGQRAVVNYGNQVVKSYSYDPINFRLTQIKSVYTPNEKVIQDYSYIYDPLGNVWSLTRNNVPTTFFNNQEVKAKANYTYDSLYRLVSANGREHAGNALSLQQALLDRSDQQYIPTSQPPTLSAVDQSLYIVYTDKTETESGFLYMGTIDTTNHVVINPLRLDGNYTSTQPYLASTGDDLVLAFKASTNESLYTYLNLLQERSTTVASGNFTLNAPSVAALGQNVYLAWVDSTNVLNYGTIDLNQPAALKIDSLGKINGNTTTVAPTLATDERHSQMYLAWVDGQNLIHIRTIYLLGEYSVPIHLNPTTDILENLFPVGTHNRIDHVHRFIRLAQSLDWSFTDTDWALRTVSSVAGLTQTKIDDAVSPYLAWIYDLVSTQGLQVNQVCALIGTVKDFGKADGPSFFQSIFNSSKVLNPPQWVDPSTGAYNLSWKFLERDEANLQIQDALSAALGVSQDELMAMAHHIYLAIRGENNQIPLTLGNLSIFYRISLLPEVVGLPILDCMAANALLHQTDLARRLDLYGGEGAKVFASLHTLMNYQSWLQETGFGAGQVQYILTGSSNNLSIQNAIIGPDTAANFLNSLNSAVAPSLLLAGTFDQFADKLFVSLNSSSLAQAYIEVLTTEGVLEKQLTRYKVVQPIPDVSTLATYIVNILPEGTRETNEFIMEMSRQVYQLLNSYPEKRDETLATLISDFENIFSLYAVVGSQSYLDKQGVVLTTDPDKLSGVIPSAFVPVDENSTTELRSQISDYYYLQQKTLTHHLASLYGVAEEVVPVLESWGGAEFWGY